MAIHDSFNLDRAVGSQSYAYKCWYNYNYGNNTMKISAKDMGKVTQAWQGEIKNWHATATDDENAYVIEDDDFNIAKQNGREIGEEKTGFNGKTGKMKVRGAIDAGVGGLGATLATTKLGATIGGKLGGGLIGKAAKNVGEKAAKDFIGSEAAKKVGEKAVKEAGENISKEVAQKASDEAINEASKEAGKNAADKTTKSAGNKSWIITAPLALATGTTYMAKKPNKDAKEACDELQNTMSDAQESLYATQEEMANMAEEIAEISDEAEYANEEANSEIEDKKSEYDVYRASYDALVEKSKSGEALTEEEKGLLKELVPVMQELGVGISETQDETTKATSEMYEDMESYQEGYDTSAETVAEVEGLTDYAESFDESTRTMCYVEAGAQTLNAGAGTKASVQAGKFAASGGIFTSWAWAFVGMGAAGAGMSGVGAAEQFKWAGDVGNEIGDRKATQELNTETLDVYDESIEGYDGNMSLVEDLELETPEDLEDMESVVEEITAGSNEAIATSEKTEGEENGGEKNTRTFSQGGEISSEMNQQQTKNNKKKMM